MKAVLFYGPQDIRYEETRIKPLEKGEILVKIQAALTCGTDVKTFRRGHPVLIKNIPSGFGHEFSGIVEKVADDVKNVKAGDRVVCANSAPCGECFYCKRGEYNLCENLNLLNGAYAEYIVVPERIVKKNTLILPPSLPFEKAAFSEPLANVVHGVERTGIKAGDSVGIIGIGPIGLMFARLCKLKGARVIVAGRNPIKLKLDVAIECVGMPEIWELIFSCVRPGGTVHFFGGCKSGSKVCFDTTKMHYGDMRLMSVFHHTPKYFRQALDLIASGDIEVDKLITAELPLDKVEYAMQQHIAGNAIKFLIKPFNS